MFGAFTAEHFTAVTDWIRRHALGVNVFQALTTLGMLAAYWGVMHYLQYDALSAVFTIHQLSPIGMLYTLSTMLFLLYWWECRTVPGWMHRLFSLLGNDSYPIYLVHPVFLSACTGLAAHFHIYLRSTYIVAIYFIVAGCAAAYASIINHLPLPHWLSICLKGKLYRLKNYTLHTKKATASRDSLFLYVCCEKKTHLENGTISRRNGRTNQ